jgi:biotin operon repressor
MRKSQSNQEKKMYAQIFGLTKGGFFSESKIRFSNLPISQKTIPKNIVSLKVE